MFAAIGAFFEMFFVLFGAGKKVAVAIDNLASIAEDESLVLKQTMAIESDAKLAALRKELKVAVPKAA